MQISVNRDYRSINKTSVVTPREGKGLCYFLHLTLVGTSVVQSENAATWLQHFQLYKTQLAVFFAATLVTPTGWSGRLCGLLEDLQEIL